MDLWFYSVPQRRWFSIRKAVINLWDRRDMWFKVLWYTDRVGEELLLRVITGGQDCRYWTKLVMQPLSSVQAFLKEVNHWGCYLFMYPHYEVDESYSIRLRIRISILVKEGDGFGEETVQLPVGIASECFKAFSGWKLSFFFNVLSRKCYSFMMEVMFSLQQSDGAQKFTEVRVFPEIYHHFQSWWHWGPGC